MWEENCMKTFGEKLIFARKAQKMTQNQLAEKMNVVRSTISNWEIGRAQPGYDALCQLAHILQYDFLFDREIGSTELKLQDYITDQNGFTVDSGIFPAIGRIRQIKSMEIRINGKNYRENDEQIRISITVGEENEKK